MAVKSQKTRRKEIKKSLIEQLRSRGSDIALFADQVPIVNRQMLSLLKTLGVTTDNIVGEEDDDL